MNSAHPSLSRLVIVLNLLVPAGVTRVYVSKRASVYARVRAHFIPGDVTNLERAVTVLFSQATCLPPKNNLTLARVEPRFAASEIRRRRGRRESRFNEEYAEIFMSGSERGEAGWPARSSYRFIGP